MRGDGSGQRPPRTSGFSTLFACQRTFRCDGCGLAIDRDRNAAANLAAWAERNHAQAPDRQAGGRVTNAPGGEGAGHRLGDGETSPDGGGTDAHALVV
jgi:transposase